LSFTLHAFFADYRPPTGKQEDGWERLQAWFKQHGVSNENLKTQFSGSLFQLVHGDLDVPFYRKRRVMVSDRQIQLVFHPVLPGTCPLTPSAWAVVRWL